ncbi:hopanoid-associated sugar epimerase [Entomobacter blattae]|uniref:Aurachin B dehydrogenase n=1 Tax=Entomobacter blattae TaxID=2762277 RepID=A0A7H1NPF3_9PROT|nr:hopanoid-associated sugar epimerase [Entomobacter blattae]QNT77663.1 Aurachin B dehydrogenase [Entomobacter blattae]
MGHSTLITGATGFVGSAVARALHKRGHQLRFLVRHESDLRNIADIEGERVEGDLLDFESLTKAVQGCRYVFHVAADYRLWVPDPARMMRANVIATIKLMKAAHHAGVERIVYCSSVAALGLKEDGSSADETTPVCPEKIVGVYKQSKYRAEQAVLSLYRETKLPVVIVNPSTPIGPRDIKPTPTGRMIVDCANGKMPAYVDTGLNIVHVDDVAEGHCLALERGRLGEKYILGGENYTLKELFNLIAGMVDVRPPLMEVSQKTVWPIAVISEWIARIAPIEPRVTREMLLMSRKKMFFSSHKAEHDLGYSARSASLAVADAIEWFCTHGMVKKKWR